MSKPTFTPTNTEADASVEDARDHGSWSADERDSLAFKAPCARCDWLVTHADCYCPWCGLKHLHEIGYLCGWSE